MGDGFDPIRPPRDSARPPAVGAGVDHVHHHTDDDRTDRGPRHDPGGADGPRRAGRDHACATPGSTPGAGRWNVRSTRTWRARRPPISCSTPRNTSRRSASSTRGCTRERRQAETAWLLARATAREEVRTTCHAHKRQLAARLNEALTLAATASVGKSSGSRTRSALIPGAGICPGSRGRSCRLRRPTQGSRSPTGSRMLARRVCWTKTLRACSKVAHRRPQLPIVGAAGLPIP